MITLTLQVRTGLLLLNEKLKQQSLWKMATVLLLAVLLMKVLQKFNLKHHVLEIFPCLAGDLKPCPQEKIEPIFMFF